MSTGMHLRPARRVQATAREPWLEVQVRSHDALTADSTQVGVAPQQAWRVVTSSRTADMC
jgi:hypothetical protein